MNVLILKYKSSSFICKKIEYGLVIIITVLYLNNLIKNTPIQCYRNFQFLNQLEFRLKTLQEYVLNNRDQSVQK